MAPLWFSKWKTIPDDEKTKMWQAIQQKFTLNDEPHIKEALYQQLDRQYRDYRHRLHKDYYCKYGTDEMRLENPLSCVSTDDWVDLVRYIGSEDFKKMSNRNKENRQKQKIGHVAGTKAFARISYDSGTSLLGLACGSLPGIAWRKECEWIRLRKKSMMSLRD